MASKVQQAVKRQGACTSTESQIEHDLVPGSDERDNQLQVYLIRLPTSAVQLRQPVCQVHRGRLQVHSTPAGMQLSASEVTKSQQLRA